MALFGNDKTQEQKAQEQSAAGQQATDNQDANMGDQNYFDAMAGEGQDQISPDMVSTPYLSMVQAGGAAAASGHEIGTWINSASGENFGDTVRAVCLAVKTAWIERDTTGKTWMTVARYEPNSIEVTKTMPKPGQRGFPTMTNPETGNKIEELFVYALMLPERAENGILFFSPTAISMTACKAWNTKIRNQRLPSGKLAPIFAFAWDLSLTTVPKPGVKGDPDDPVNRNTKLGTVARGPIVAFDLFKAYVQPQLGASQNLLAIAAPEADASADSL
jgi:hypothetical protein